VIGRQANPRQSHSWAAAGLPASELPPPHSSQIQGISQPPGDRPGDRGTLLHGLSGEIISGVPAVSEADKNLIAFVHLHQPQAHAAHGAASCKNWDARKR
jgi:hypothetical protein